MNQQVTKELLPIKTRVYHWSGDPKSGHGAGTIIAYNGITASNWAQKNLREAAEMADSVGLLGGLVSSFYGGDRCPYVVQWDNGLKEVYEIDSVTEVNEAPHMYGVFDASDDHELGLSSLIERYSRPLKYYTTSGDPEHPIYTAYAWMLDPAPPFEYWDWVLDQLQKAAVPKKEENE